MPMCRFALPRRSAAACAALVLALAALTPTGCGQKKNAPTAVVRGKVTVGDRPLGGGMVLFQLADYPNVPHGTAFIRGDGTYESKKNIPVGKCKVMVQTAYLNPVQPPAKPGDPPRKSPEDYVTLSGDTKIGKVFTPIPGKYEKAESTTLTFDVQSGENTYDIKLDEK
ncbi:MAG: hypothetical protein ABGY75_11925 [Gemmataceae bacterium]